MTNSQQNNPLHGITLQKMLEDLVKYYQFDTLAELIPINCFRQNPSIASSLKFLRKTPWARKKVEALYLQTLPQF
ncbi:DNA-binding protein VF530 [Flavobacterium sp. NST-5]|uniref:DNA-binding protein VF530 n=1 Tax=Flavobacterium ichthyis TaxID=2698827 RepID=A0ABW9ZB06_9FLAO|nr:VF530 family protein [Flavobacterium ichthyis]NBL64260.1 DNA-binding protein VF530 [Flavobacterium ichthyis]